VLLRDGKAYGVEVQRDGALTTVEARAEVIVSAGAINAPQLLQISGIGPAEWLRKAGIEPVHPMEGVGRNYQDHLQVRIVFRAVRPMTFNDELRSWYGQLRAGLRYAIFHKAADGQCRICRRVLPNPLCA